MAQDKHKILYISSASGGGVIKEIQTHCKLLRNRYIIKVVNLFSADLSIDAVSVERLNLRLRRRIPLQILTYRKLPLKIGEIVSSFTPDVIISMCDIISYWVSKATNSIPFIPVFQGLNSHRLKPIAKYMMKQVFNESWGVVFVSEPLRRDFLRYYRIEHKRTFILHSPVDTLNSKSPDFPKKRKAIAFIGRLSPHKNPALFIKTSALLSAQFPELEYWVVGNGPLRNYLEKLAFRENILGRVKFYGWQDDIDSILRRSLVLVNTSKYEGFGRVLIEAIARGVPVVCSARGGPEEILSGESGGIICEPYPELIAQKVKDIIENNEIREQLVDKGIRRIASKYSNEHFIRSITAIIDNAVRRH